MLKIKKDVKDLHFRKIFGILIQVKNKAETEIASTVFPSALTGVP